MKLEDLNLTERERDTIQPLNDVALCEAAMCLWEYMLELLRHDRAEEELSSAIVPVVEAIGYAELRMRVLNLADACHVGFYVGQANGLSDAGGSFDWDWCPWFVENCVDWTEGEAPTLVSEWIEVIRDVAMLEAEEANAGATSMVVRVNARELRLIVDALAIINPDEAEDLEAARQLALRLERELA